MPKAAAAKKPRSKALATATPPLAPRVVDTQALRKRVTRKAPTDRQDPRTIFGASLNLERIANCLRNADYGAPRDLTDLSRETIDTDPHLAAVLNKRIGAVASLPLDIIPADGPGVDPERAAFYADVVRAQVERIPRLKKAIRQLAWGLFDGRSALEIRWSLRPGERGAHGQVKHVAEALSWIHPRRLIFGPDRELRIVDQPVSQGFVEVGTALRDHPWKFIQFLPQLFGEYPEREGLSRRCLYWSFFKRFGARERMILLELFAKPWRTTEVDADAEIDDGALEDADQVLEELPGNGYGRFPRGVTLKVHQPVRQAGDIHGEVITEADKQNSKLVLGQTGTTDAQPMGLGSTQANVMQAEQLMLTLADADVIAEAIEDGLTDAIIEINFGSAALLHAPRVALKADIRNRQQELECLQKTLNAGLPVALKDAYEVSGFRQPAEDEPTLQVESTLEPAKIVYPVPKGGEGGGGAPAAPAAPGQPAQGGPEADAVPDIDLAPTDVAKVVTVNEARTSQGLGPLLLPDGAPDPDGNLTIAEFEAKRLAAGETVGTAEGAAEAKELDPEDPAAPAPPPSPQPAKEAPSAPATPAPAPGAAPAAPDGPPPDDSEGGADDDPEAPGTKDAPAAVRVTGGVSRAVLMSGGALTEVGAKRLLFRLGTAAPLVVEAMRARAAHRTPEQLYGIEVCAAKQPSGVYGTPETLIDKAAKELSLRTAEWGKKLAAAGANKTSSVEVLTAVGRAGRALDLDEFVRALSRRILHGEMLGALESSYEGSRGVVVAPATFAALPSPGVPAKPSFANSSFKSAKDFFEKKKVLTKDQFDALEAGAKRRAFTIARLQSQQLLELAHAELGRLIAEGADVKQFEAFMKERVVSAGWTPASPSHIATVARTNIVQAQAVGRLVEMTAPAAIADRPYWQNRGVRDSRQRETHGAIDGWVLKASDPFWQSAVPPYGYNCRDRLVSLSQKQVDRMGLTVHDGSEIKDLPDPGFHGSGMRGLLGDFGA